MTASELYIGGLFDVMDGQPRANLAAVDYTGAVSTTWTPSADNRVRVHRALSGRAVPVRRRDFLTIDGDPSAEDPGPAGPGDRRDDALEVPPRLPDPPVRVLRRDLSQRVTVGRPHRRLQPGHRHPDLDTADRRRRPEHGDHGRRHLRRRPLDNVCVGVTDGATIRFAPRAIRAMVLSYLLAQLVLLNPADEAIGVVRTNQQGN